MKKYIIPTISGLIMLCVSFLSLAASEDNIRVNDDKVTLNFVDADIESVIKAIGQITNKNFLLDPRVKGTISINTANPVPRTMTYQILLSALRVQGFAAVEENGYTSVVPEVDAKGKFTPKTTSGKSYGSQIVTQVYVLKYENSNQLVSVIKPLLSPNSVVNSYPSSNALIITDYADNIGKIAKLLDTIDKPSQAENVLVKLKFASAVEISQTINRLLGETVNADPSRRLIAVADARSNAIILHSENQSMIERATSLIGQLDVPTNAGSSIHVVYLKNADSTKLASTLRSLMSGNSREKIASESITSAAQATTPTPSIINTATQANNIQQSNNLNAITSPFSPLASAQENGMIQADAATNSLLITAPDHVFNMLRGVIDKLDMRRAQLYVEALIAEVSTDKASEFGIQWQDLDAFKGSTLDNGSLQAFAGTNFNRGGNIRSVAANLNNANSGFNIGLLAGRVNIPGIGQVTNLGLLAHALESDANANILSKPNLLMLDNEEAKIVIGQNVPFITGQYAQTGGSSSVTPFQTIERQDVGLTLQVKPQISEGNTIKLKIHQEVSSVADTANSAGITTNKRAIDTSVLVDDGNIIVLGGLIEDSITDSVDKVPFLGDIPGIGALFRSTGRSHKKTNLMIFLRPYVLRNADDTAKMSNERYDYIIQQQRNITPTKVWPLPETPEVTLPDRFEHSLKARPAAPLTIEEK
jgi:general secretion pathway protein D